MNAAIAIHDVIEFTIKPPVPLSIGGECSTLVVSSKDGSIVTIDMYTPIPATPYTIEEEIEAAR